MRHSKTLGALACVLACVLASISLSGCATTNGVKTSAQIIEELQEEARAIARGRGYDRKMKQGSGHLGNRQRNVTWVDLKAGEKYLVVGLCDEACSDIDLEVWNGEGFVLASDTLDDAIPIFEFRPDEDGRYVVGTRMIACESEPCIFAVGIYGE